MCLFSFSFSPLVAYLPPGPLLLVSGSRCRRITASPSALYARTFVPASRPPFLLHPPSLADRTRRPARDASNAGVADAASIFFYVNYAECHSAFGFPFVVYLRCLSLFFVPASNAGCFCPVRGPLVPRFTLEISKSRHLLMSKVVLPEQRSGPVFPDFPEKFSHLFAYMKIFLYLCTCFRTQPSNRTQM